MDIHDCGDGFKWAVWNGEFAVKVQPDDSIKSRVLEILNRNLDPWTFEGDEPFAVELIAFVELVTWTETSGQLHSLAKQKMAVEFGFRCSEKGWNLDRALLEYQSIMKRK